MKREMIQVFVGEYMRKVQRGGWVRFPKDWLMRLGNDREVYIMPCPFAGRPLMIFSAWEFNTKLKRLSVKNVPDKTLIVLGNVTERVKISADGRMRIPARLLAHARISDGVRFSGKIRMMAVTAAKL